MPVALELFCLGTLLAANPYSELQAELENFISTCSAEIGVAVITDSGDTICVNGESPYPLHSVAKLHQAIAVADYLNHNEIPLETKITIQAHELQPDTFSPLRDEHPSGDFSITIAELLKFSLQQSDNNACDLMFNRLIGIKATNAYIQSIGIEHFAIRHDERAMHANPECANENWSTPKDAAKLIYDLFTNDRFDNPYHRISNRFCGVAKQGKIAWPRHYPTRKPDSRTKQERDSIPKSDIRKKSTM